MTQQNTPAGGEREALAAELKAAYDKVSVYPEGRGMDGLMDLLALRNLVPKAVEALAKQGAGEPWVHGPYDVAFMGAGVWGGIPDELPPELVGKKVWLTVAAPASQPTESAIPDFEYRSMVDGAEQWVALDKKRLRVAKQSNVWMGLDEAQEKGYFDAPVEPPYGRAIVESPESAQGAGAGLTFEDWYDSLEEAPRSMWIGKPQPSEQAGWQQSDKGLVSRVEPSEQAQQVQADAGIDDMLERFKNPMTPYGMLIRALRIVTGTTMMEMANYLGVTPANLSSMEFGRKAVTREDVVNAAGFFASKGCVVTLPALEYALRAAMSREQQGGE